MLRARGWRRPGGRPLAVLALHRDPRRVDVHPVADLSHRIVREGHFHLEFLSTQSVERTLELIAAGGPLREPQT
ncbi:hypothetical protein GCM10009797_09600 [Nocardioides hwasunensis]